MIENNYNTESQEKPSTSKSTKSKKGSAFSQILNGEFLSKDFVLNNLTYILFIFYPPIALVFILSIYTLHSMYCTVYIDNYTYCILTIM